MNVPEICRASQWEAHPIAISGPAFRFVSMVALLALLSSGCASYSVQHESPLVAMPAKQAAPIPVAIGIMDPEQRTFSREVVPSIENFKRQLDEVGLFQCVHYPVGPLDKLDATLLVRIETHGKQRPKELPKAFVAIVTCGLSELFFYYHDDWQGTGTVTMVRDGKPIKTYTATSSAVLRYKLGNLGWDPVSMYASAADAIEKRLVSRMIEQLVRDREFLNSALSVGSPVQSNAERSP